MRWLPKQRCHCTTQARPAQIALRSAPVQQPLVLRIYQHSIKKYLNLLCWIRWWAHDYIIHKNNAPDIPGHHGKILIWYELLDNSEAGDKIWKVWEMSRVPYLQDVADPSGDAAINVCKWCTESTMWGRSTDLHAIYVNIWKWLNSRCDQWLRSRSPSTKLMSEGDIILPERLKIGVDEII